jgi:hypothetical protein
VKFTSFVLGFFLLGCGASPTQPSSPSSFTHHYEGSITITNTSGPTPFYAKGEAVAYDLTFTSIGEKVVSGSLSIGRLNGSLLIGSRNDKGVWVIDVQRMTGIEGEPASVRFEVYPHGMWVNIGIGLTNSQGS